MGKIVTVQKITTAEAVLITSDEEEAVVRGWLAEMFLGGIPNISPEDADELAKEQDIQPIIDERSWFARDKDSTVVYIIPAGDFLTMFEEVGEEDITDSLEEDLQRLTDTFKLGE